MSRCLGYVRSFEESCVVPEDPGMVVRHARPTTAADRATMHAQYLQRLTAERRHAGLPTAAEAARRTRPLVPHWYCALKAKLRRTA
jgi:hypothetical protein